MKIKQYFSSAVAFVIGSLMLAGKASAAPSTGGLETITDLGEGAANTFLGLEMKIWIIGAIIAATLIIFRVAPIALVLFGLFLGGAFLGNIDEVGRWLGIGTAVV